MCERSLSGRWLSPPKQNGVVKSDPSFLDPFLRQSHVNCQPRPPFKISLRKTNVTQVLLAFAQRHGIPMWQHYEFWACHMYRRDFFEYANKRTWGTIWVQTPAYISWDDMQALEHLYLKPQVSIQCSFQPLNTYFDCCLTMFKEIVTLNSISSLPFDARNLCSISFQRLHVKPQFSTQRTCFVFVCQCCIWLCRARGKLCWVSLEKRWLPFAETQKRMNRLGVLDSWCASAMTRYCCDWRRAPFGFLTFCSAQLLRCSRIHSSVLSMLYAVICGYRDTKLSALKPKYVIF